LLSRLATPVLRRQKEMTPLMVAKKIGEDDAARLIEALLAGLSGDDIRGKDDDESDGETENSGTAETTVVDVSEGAPQAKAPNEPAAASA
jgi:hypothetical protein